MSDVSAESPSPIPAMSGKSLLVLAGFGVLCFGAAGIGGAATGPEIANWYQTLSKPSWQPPAWLFGPVWSVLFAMIAVSGWLVWRSTKGGEKTAAFAAYGVQLVLNVGWSVIFFGLHQLGWALVEIGFLWLAIAATAWFFRRHSSLAAGLLLPYLAWVSFASFLNFTIWQLNS